jgi:hypothetical protein
MLEIKKNPIEKHTFFSFNILQQRLDLNFLKFGSGQNLRILSDSESGPQHCGYGYKPFPMAFMNVDAAPAPAPAQPPLHWFLYQHEI